MSEIPNNHFIIERDEVRAGDISRTQEFLASFLQSEATARIQFQNLILSFNGFDGDCEEVFENDHVRAFVQKLDLEFPYWLYFLSPYYPSFYAIAMCFVPPCLTDVARAEIHPPRLIKLMESRWLPALYHVGKWTTMAEHELDLTALRWGDYFKGPQKPPIVN